MDLFVVEYTNDQTKSLSLSQNLSEGKYKTFEEFKADAQLIVHNTAILYGGPTGFFLWFFLSLRFPSITRRVFGPSRTTS